MTINRRSILTLSSFALLGVTLGPAHAAEPTIAGTWELNVAASQSTDPMPKSVTRTYELNGNTEKMTGTIVTADGKTIPISFVLPQDGKDHPFQSPGADTLAGTVADPYTVNFVVKKDGKVVVTGTRTLAKDGKTMTLRNKGTNAEGKPMESTMVYDRR